MPHIKKVSSHNDEVHVLRPVVNKNKIYLCPLHSKNSYTTTRPDVLLKPTSNWAEVVRRSNLSWPLYANSLN